MLKQTVNAPLPEKIIAWPDKDQRCSRKRSVPECLAESGLSRKRSGGDKVRLDGERDGAAVLARGAAARTPLPSPPRGLFGPLRCRQAAIPPEFSLGQIGGAGIGGTHEPIGHGFIW